MRTGMKTKKGQNWKTPAVMAYIDSGSKIHLLAWMTNSWTE